MADLKKFIRDVPDFPKEGIVFKDITPLLQNPSALQETVDRIADRYVGTGIELITGTEARGFILAPMVAYKLDTGFVAIRKAGKLPYKTESITYDLEYGTDTIEVHKDAISPGQKVLMVDDLLATGGTMAACCDLVEKLGGNVVGCAFLVELCFLKGAEKLEKYDIFSLIKYD